jgi:hypothetical protein
MWRRRRRLQQLETAVSEGKAERAELRQRLDWFEEIAAAAGAAPTAGRRNTLPSAPLPSSLLAAAGDLRGHDVAVQLEVAGASVVAVVGGPGDPREWWTAIWQAARPEPADAEEAPA